MFPFNITFGPFTLEASPSKLAEQQRSHCPEESALPSLRCQLEKRHPGILRRIESTGEATTDIFLLRWLQARGEHTVDALAAHADWRESFIGHSPRGILETSIADELEAEKVYLQGLDRNGFPLLLFRAAKHRVGVHSAERTTRLMAFAVDNAVHAANLSLSARGRIVCIFDMAGVGGMNIDLHFLQQTFGMFATHYPNCIFKVFFINSPILFWAAWRCVTPFVAPETRGKISFLSGGSGKRQLLDMVGPACLPSDLGGTAELVPVHVAVAIARGETTCVRSHLDQSISKEGFGFVPAAFGRLGEGASAAKRALKKSSRAAQRAAHRIASPHVLVNGGMFAGLMLIGLLTKMVQVALVHIEFLSGPALCSGCSNSDGCNCT